MKLSTVKAKIENNIFTSLESIFKSQDQLDFNQFAVTTLESLMLLERSNYLVENINDAGNGSYIRNFKSLSKSSLKISVPRTRSGNFHPMILDLVKVNREQINDLSLLLYRKGLSSRDIENIMSEFFGESVSRSTIVNLASSFHEIRKKWEARKLDSYYKAVQCDALFVSVRRADTYTKEAVYVAYGVKEDNTRELLLLETNPTESASMWTEYCEKLRQRGVDQVDLFIADGLKGFSDAVKTYFPESDIQRCVTHLKRNWLNKVRPRDKAQFANEIKEIFDNFDDTYADKVKINKKISNFVNNWSKSYSFVYNIQNEDFAAEYFTYTKYPPQVRRMIYTTNSIENLNRQIRKVTKTKVNFDKESNMLDLIFMIIQDFEASNWQRYPVTAYQHWPRNTQ